MNSGRCDTNSNYSLRSDSKNNLTQKSSSSQNYGLRNKNPSLAQKGKCSLISSKAKLQLQRSERNMGQNTSKRKMPIMLSPQTSYPNAEDKLKKNTSPEKRNTRSNSKISSKPLTFKKTEIVSNEVESSNVNNDKSTSPVKMSSTKYPKKNSRCKNSTKVITRTKVLKSSDHEDSDSEVSQIQVKSLNQNVIINQETVEVASSSEKLMSVKDLSPKKKSRFCSNKVNPATNLEYEMLVSNSVPSKSASDMSVLKDFNLHHDFSDSSTTQDSVDSEDSPIRRFPVGGKGGKLASFKNELKSKSHNCRVQNLTLGSCDQDSTAKKLSGPDTSVKGSLDMESSILTLKIPSTSNDDLSGPKKVNNEESYKHYDRNSLKNINLPEPSLSNKNNNLIPFIESLTEAALISKCVGNNEQQMPSSTEQFEESSKISESKINANCIIENISNEHNQMTENTNSVFSAKIQGIESDECSDASKSDQQNCDTNINLDFLTISDSDMNNYLQNELLFEDTLNSTYPDTLAAMSSSDELEDMQFDTIISSDLTEDIDHFAIPIDMSVMISAYEYFLQKNNSPVSTSTFNSCEYSPENISSKGNVASTNEKSQHTFNLNQDFKSSNLNLETFACPLKNDVINETKQLCEISSSIACSVPLIKEFETAQNVDSLSLDLQITLNPELNICNSNCDNICETSNSLMEESSCEKAEVSISDLHVKDRKSKTNFLFDKKTSKNKSLTYKDSKDKIKNQNVNTSEQFSINCIEKELSKENLCDQSLTINNYDDNLKNVSVSKDCGIILNGDSSSLINSEVINIDLNTCNSNCDISETQQVFKPLEKKTSNENIGVNSSYVLRKKKKKTYLSLGRKTRKCKKTVCSTQQDYSNEECVNILKGTKTECIGKEVNPIEDNFKQFRNVSNCVSELKDVFADQQSSKPCGTEMLVETSCNKNIVYNANSEREELTKHLNMNIESEFPYNNLESILNIGKKGHINGDLLKVPEILVDQTVHSQIALVENSNQCSHSSEFEINNALYKSDIITKLPFTCIQTPEKDWEKFEFHESEIPLQMLPKESCDSHDSAEIESTKDAQNSCLILGSEVKSVEDQIYSFPISEFNSSDQSNLPVTSTILLPQMDLFHNKINLTPKNFSSSENNHLNKSTDNMPNSGDIADAIERKLGKPDKVKNNSPSKTKKQKSIKVANSLGKNKETDSVFMKKKVKKSNLETVPESNIPGKALKSSKEKVPPISKKDKKICCDDKVLKITFNTNDNVNKIGNFKAVKLKSANAISCYSSEDTDEISQTNLKHVDKSLCVELDKNQQKISVTEDVNAGNTEINSRIMCNAEKDPEIQTLDADKQTVKKNDHNFKIPLLKVQLKKNKSEEMKLNVKNQMNKTGKSKNMKHFPDSKITSVSKSNDSIKKTANEKNINKKSTRLSLKTEKLNSVSDLNASSDIAVESVAISNNNNMSNLQTFSNFSTSQNFNCEDPFRTTETSNKKQEIVKSPIDNLNLQFKPTTDYSNRFSNSCSTTKLFTNGNIQPEDVLILDFEAESEIDTESVMDFPLKDNSRVETTDNYNSNETVAVESAFTDFWFSRFSRTDNSQAGTFIPSFEKIIKERDMKTNHSVVNVPHFENELRSWKRDFSSDESETDCEHSFKRKKIDNHSNERSCNLLLPHQPFEDNRMKSPERNDDIADNGSNVSDGQFSSITISENKYCVKQMDNYFSNSFDQSYPTHSKNSNLPNEAEVFKNTSMQVDSDLGTSIRQILELIKTNCKQGNINEALVLVKKYVPISSDHVRKSIVKELWLSLIDCIKFPQTYIPSEACERTVSAMHQIICDYNLHDSEICSVIITDCLQQNVSTHMAEEMFNICKKKNISLTFQAISTYAELINSTECSISKFLTFFEYVKQIRDFPFPITLFNKLIDVCIKKENFFQIPFSDEFKRIFNLLCSANSNEVDCQHLQKFIYCCVQNEHWNQIVEFFRAWVKKSKLLHCIHQTFAFALEDSGLCFERFAAAFHGNIASDIPMHHLALFGQIGVALMLEAFSKGEQKSALEILYVLHKYQINYHELQIPVCHISASDLRFQEVGDPFDIFVFPHTVAFTAIDICLHFGRTKDAFEIFNSFSFLLSNDGLKSDYKSFVTVRCLVYLLKLAQDLIHTDPLNRGIKVMRNLLTTVGKEIASEDITILEKDLKNLYNEFMIEVMNRQQVKLALEFYQYYCDTLREFLIIHPHVLRGLVTSFAENGFVEEAKELFHIGLYSENVYSLEKPKVEDICWCLTLVSSWTKQEIKLAIETYIEMLFPVLFLKHSKSDNEEWFPIKIMFREEENQSLGVNCVNEAFKSAESALKETCTILKSLDSDLTWTENACDKSLTVRAENFYNYWKREREAEDASTKFLKLPVLNIKENANSSLEKEKKSAYNGESSVGKNLNQVSADQVLSENVNYLIEKSTLHNENQTNSKKLTVMTSYSEQRSASPSLSYICTVPNSSLSPLSSCTNSPSKKSNISPVCLSPNELSLPSISSPTKIRSLSLQRSPKNPNLVLSPHSISINASPHAGEHSANYCITNEQTICISDNNVPNVLEVELPNAVDTVISNQEKSPLASCQMQINPAVLKKSVNTDATEIANDELKAIEKPKNVHIVNKNSSPSISAEDKSLTVVAEQSSAVPIISQKCVSSALVTSNHVNPGKNKVFQNKIQITSKGKSLQTSKIKLRNRKFVPRKKLFSPTKNELCIVVNDKSRVITTNLNKSAPSVRDLSTIKLTTSKNVTSNNSNSSLCSHEEFDKIVHFLKTKILQKCKNLDSEEQHQKAVDLTRTFICQHKVESKLDKKSMKLLFEFADKNI